MTTRVLAALPRGAITKGLAGTLALVSLVIGVLPAWGTIEIIQMNSDGFLHSGCAWLIADRPPPLWQMVTTGFGAGALAVASVWFGARCALGRPGWKGLILMLTLAAVFFGAWVAVGSWTIWADCGG